MSHIDIHPKNSLLYLLAPPPQTQNPLEEFRATPFQPTKSIPEVYPASSGTGSRAESN